MFELIDIQSLIYSTKMKNLFIKVIRDNYFASKFYFLG